MALFIYTRYNLYLEIYILCNPGISQMSFYNKNNVGKLLSKNTYVGTYYIGVLSKWSLYSYMEG